jgi:hypothetical protein
MNYCSECAFKHLADARKVYGELCQGYRTDAEHIASFSADMSLAAQHLVERHPGLANRIRDARLEVMDTIFTPEILSLAVPPFGDLLGEVLGVIRAEGRADGEEKGR